MQPESQGSTPSTGKSRGMIAVLIATGVVSVGALVCCGVVVYTTLIADNPFLMKSCFNGDRATLEKYAHFTYPASATNIHEDCAVWQDAQIWVWFEMDPADMDAFVESTMVEGPLGPATTVPAQGPVADESALLYGRWTEQQYGQELWIDTSDPEHTVVILRFTAF